MSEAMLARVVASLAKGWHESVCLLHPADELATCRPVIEVGEIELSDLEFGVGHIDKVRSEELGVRGVNYGTIEL